MHNYSKRNLIACAIAGCLLAVAFLYSESESRQSSASTLLSVSAGEANADIDRAEHVLDTAASIPRGPLSHVKEGSKYSQELADLARRAEPDRKAALAKLDALRRRSEGGKSSGGPASKHKIPAALIEMENLAHRRTAMSSGVAGLGKLARSHGIESSKKMLAEIMSLRHYKQSNDEINNIANGFEAHSSISHRFKKHIDRDLKVEQDKRKRRQAEKEAAALRLEAGRVTRAEMKRSISNKVEQRIGSALQRTFKPMQMMLRKDEKSLDKLIAPKASQKEADHIADKEAKRLRADLMHKMDEEVGRVLTIKETEMEHKSSTYIAKVHEKALQTLNKVVNPDEIGKTPIGAAETGVVKSVVTISEPSRKAISWTNKIANFLKSTQRLIQNEQNNNAERPLSFNTAIEATQGELEQQLKSVKLTAHKPLPANSAVETKANSGRQGGKSSHEPPKSSKLMSPQQKSAFKKALDSYL